MAPTPETLRRDAQIRQAWLDQVPVKQIAATHQLSTARVYQILRSMPGLVQQRARAQQLRDQQVIDWSRTHPGVSLAQAVRDLGRGEREIRTVLGERVTLHEPIRRAGRRTYSDDELTAVLQDFLDQAGGDTRAATYQQLAQANDWPACTRCSPATGAPWSYRRCNDWLRTQPDGPSGSLPRRRLCGWHEMVTEVARLHG